MRLFFRTLRFLLLLLLAVAAVYAVTHYKLVGYGIFQLKGQLNIILQAKPVEEVMADASFPDSLKRKLRIVSDIRRFAIDSLGLNDSKNYTTYYDQKGKAALWVLTACEPFQMKEYEWEFPFLGKVSYKGFFEKEKGLPELEALKQQGYDTDYSPTGGWSTLGWFKDPILSNMLRRTEGQLAELIIHELTHATLYLPGSVDYNENFATFTGEQGALRFLEYTFGKNSKELSAYAALQQDEDVFGNYMVRACHSLDSLYKSMNQDLPEHKKRLLKRQKIEYILLNINNLKLNFPERFVVSEKKGELPNNCFFMSYRRYRKQQNEFKDELQLYQGDLKAWLKDLKEEKKSPVN